MRRIELKGQSQSIEAGDTQATSGGPSLRRGESTMIEDIEPIEVKRTREIFEEKWKAYEKAEKAFVEAKEVHEEAWRAYVEARKAYVEVRDGGKSPQ